VYKHFNILIIFSLQLNIPPDPTGESVHLDLSKRMVHSLPTSLNRI